MPFVQADIDALDTAYKSGALIVRTADGRSHELRTIEEYQALKRLMQNEVNEVAGTTVSHLVRVGFASGVK